MSVNEFWDGDFFSLLIYKRKHEIELEQMSFNAWVQGQYIVTAVNADSRTKKIEYPKEPFRMSEMSDEEKAAKNEAAFFKQQQQFEIREINQKNAEKQKARKDKERLERLERKNKS